MTLQEMEAYEGEVLTCKQVASVLGMCEQNIHGQAMQEPRKLGFPVIVAGTRVKIPRRPFIAFMKGET